MKLKLISAAILALGIAMPAHGDEVEETIQAALEAYRAGDVKAAKEEIDFVSQLLGQLKAQGLKGFLPAALDGWTREDLETQNVGAFGGGQMASARYDNGSERLEIQLMADNQMVTAMGAMFGNATLMGAMGTVKRINRQKLVVTNDGEVQTLINNRIMVQITGSADVEAKLAYFEALDMAGLKDF